MTITPAEQDIKRSFFGAVYGNDCQTVRNILTGPIIHDDGSTSVFDPNTPDVSGCTALHIAVNNQQRDMLGLLLDFNANPNKLDARGLSPFHEALVIDPPLEIEPFISKGADIHSPNPYFDLTPIQIVTAIGKSDSLFFRLVRAGAKTDILTEQRESLLHLAAMSGNMRIAQYLFDSGNADLDLCNAAGQTPVDVAGTQLMRDTLQIWKRMKDSESIKAHHIARLQKLDEISNKHRRLWPSR